MYMTRVIVLICKALETSQQPNKVTTVQTETVNDECYEE